MRLVVVSLPASSNSTTNCSSSASLSASASSRAATRALTRSGPGLRLRFWTSPAKYSRNSRNAALMSSGIGVPGSVLSASTTLSDQSLKVAYCSGGTPSISEITITGSGTARSAITSISPLRAALLSSSDAIAQMRGSRSRMRRGVKSRVTSLLRRVWMGGSEPSTVGTSPNASICSWNTALAGWTLENAE